MAPKEISVQEAQRRIIEMVSGEDDILNSEVDNEGQIIIYTGVYIRHGKIYDEPRE
jgi:hypothetical protein